MKKLEEMRIVVLGNGGVGKTSVTIAYTKDEFISQYNPTIEDCYRMKMTVDRKPLVMEIMDTAGQEAYASLRDMVVGDGDVFMIVYAIDDIESFLAVEQYQELIKTILDENKGNDIPIVLLGNKADLETERLVEKKQAEELANRLGMVFLECSAQTRLNIVDAFERAVRLYREHNVGMTAQDTGKRDIKGCLIL